MPDQVAGVEDPKDLGNSAERWCAELDAYDRAAQEWERLARRIVERYSLIQDNHDQVRARTSSSWAASESGYNILWSNVQTMREALFARPPVPVVERRHRDPDPVGRLAAQVLQRALDAEMERDRLFDVFDSVNRDFLLVGRGVPWVRYDPTFETTKVETTVPEEDVEIADERAPVEHVPWQDFSHKPCRDFDELRRTGWVARRLYLNMRDGVERFGEKFRNVQLTSRPAKMAEDMVEKYRQVVATAEVREIWDAAERKVIWVAPSWKEDVLDEVDDPLGLEGFFPCPMPAYATLSGSSLLPTPDYEQYRGLAEQLDDLTERIDELIGYIQVLGIYDSTMDQLANLLSTGGRRLNRMFPVDNMSAYLGKGSAGSTIQGVVQFLPIDMFAATLAQLYEARETAKRELFEISGIADIVRGSLDNKYERLGQSQLKGQYADRRIGGKRRTLDTCIRDTLRIKAEIIVEHFQPERLRALSGFDLMPDVAYLARTSENGDSVVEQVWERIVRMLRDDRSRGFRIDIETDSTVEAESGEESERRVAFIDSAANLMERALPMVQFDRNLAPLVGEMLLFGVRSFRAGRPLEGAFEDLTRKLEQAAAEPPPEGPSPEEQKMQLEQQKAELEMQGMQQELEIKRMEAGMGLQAKQAEAQITLQTKQSEAEIKAQADIRTAEIEAITSMQELEVKQAELEMQSQELEMKRRQMVVEAAVQASQPAPERRQ